MTVVYCLEQHRRREKHDEQKKKRKEKALRGYTDVDPLIHNACQLLFLFVTFPFFFSFCVYLANLHHKRSYAAP